MDKLSPMGIPWFRESRFTLPSTWPVRRAFGNGPFIEGWAVYTENVREDALFEGYDPTPAKERPADISERLCKVHRRFRRCRRSWLALHAEDTGRTGE